jgi:hypothetical protein
MALEMFSMGWSDRIDSKASYLVSDTPVEDDNDNDNDHNNNSPNDSHPNVHPLHRELTAQINDYILTNWPFDSATARQSYMDKHLPYLACLCFPFALDERIHLIARLFALVYLHASAIATLDSDDAEACLASLRDLATGCQEVDRDSPEAWMLCDLLDEIRSHEYALVDEIVAATWRFLRSRVVQRGRRATRRRDEPALADSFPRSFVAAGMLLPLHRFATGTDVDEEEFEVGNCSPGDFDRELQQIFGV